MTTRSISGLEVKEFADADEIPAGDKARAAQVQIGGLRVWMFTFEPGWRYTEHFESNPCSAPHAAFVASGRLHIVMEDGTEAEAGPGSVVTIGPGHDAWTVGDEPCVFVDFADSVIG